MFDMYQLRNNANVMLVPQKDAQSVTVLIMYPIGSRYEPEHLSGVSHYIEHLMFKGTIKRKNTLVLTREIDRLGAEYNAFTSKEYTGYYIKTDGAYVETALDILSDMLFRSTFDPKEMEREKGPIVEELRMYRDNPSMNIDNVFEDLMYAGCPLGRDIGGTPAHVMGFKRPEVLAFKKKYYGPENMTIVVAGNVTEKTRQLVETYFGNEKKKALPAQTVLPGVFGSAKKQDRIMVEKKETDQVQLMLGFPGLAYMAPERTTAGVLNTILGGSMSSRLFIQVRERRGLAYMIQSGADAFRDIGHVFVRAGLEAKNVNKAINVICDEMEKIIDKGVTKRELADAKTHIRGALTLSLEDSSAQADWYAKQALFAKRIQTPDERLKQFDTVTADDVKRLAARLFDREKMRVAIIGNIEKDTVVF